MQFDRGKFKEVILYVASKCAPTNLGAVKLHKVLYFADMLSFVQTGLPITGAEYRKRPLGPTADILPKAIAELQADKALRVELIDYFGYRKKQFSALRVPKEGALSERERGLLDEMIEFVCHENTAKTISEFSHKRPWEMVGFGEVITYNSAFLLFPEQASENTLAMTGKEKISIEDERSKSNPMGFTTGEAFRSQFRTA